jgi:predicted secreted protein
MAYTRSQAQSGKGSVLSIGIGTVPTYTIVGEVTTADFSGTSASVVDTTNFQSANYREFLPTIINSGNLKLTGNRVSGDAGQVLVSSTFLALQVVAWKLVLPLANGQTTTGDTMTFFALVQSDEVSVGVDKVVSFSISLQISGPINVVVGA